MPLDPLTAAFVAVEENADLLGQKALDLAEPALAQLAKSVATNVADDVAQRTATDVATDVATRTGSETAATVAERVAAERLPDHVKAYLAAHPPKAGKDGLTVKGDPGASIVWRGKFVQGNLYQANDAVEFDGSSYIATRATKATPPNKPWELLSRKGRDGQSWFGGGGSATGGSGGVTSVNGQTGVVVIQLAYLDPLTATAADIINALIAAGLMTAPTTAYWPMLSLTSG